MTASQIRLKARENLSGNWGVSVATALVAAIFGGLIAGGSSGIQFNLNEHTLRNLPPAFWASVLPFLSVAGMLGIVSFILGGVVELGYARFLLKQFRREPLVFSDLFSQFHRFGTGFAQRFLRSLYVALWSLLLVIPGVIKSFSYAMTPFILEDHPEMTASEAINASKALMDGHKMDLFILGLSFIGWQLLACLTLGVGFLFLNPYMSAANAVFYRNISGQQSGQYVPPVEF